MIIPSLYIDEYWSDDQVWSPKVRLDKNKELFSIEGNIITSESSALPVLANWWKNLDSSAKFILQNQTPSNSYHDKFLDTIYAWWKLYAKEPNKQTNFHLKLGYINTVSSKFFLDLFYMIEANIKNTKIHWHFINSDAYEMGNEFEELLEIPFIYIDEKE